MSDDELAAELRKRYLEAKSAARGEVTNTLLMFGIKYADLLHRDNIRYVVTQANIDRGPTTITMGRRLAGHVTITDPEW